MNLSNAQYILTVLEAGSLSAAARRLYITQSALSQTVKQVERDLGTAIFSREGGRLKLTYAGERYVEAARAMLRIEQNLRREMNEIRQETSGCLRFGVPAQQGMRLLPAILRPFAARYPHVRVEVEEQGSGTLARMVADGVLDIALARTVLREPSVAYEPIEPEHIGLLAGRDTALYRAHPNGTTLRLADAASEPFVFLKAGHNARTVQDRMAQRQNLTLTRMIELDTFETAKRVTVACGAVMLAPFSILKNDPDIPDAAHFYPLESADNGQSTDILYHRSLFLTQYMLDWIELIRKHYRSIGEDV